MTPRPLLWAAIVAGAVILAIVALLASGSFAPAATSRGAVQPVEAPVSLRQQVALVTAERLRGAPHSAPDRLAATAALTGHWTEREPDDGLVATPVGGAPQPTGGVGTALLGGLATWYDTCSGCAAAGPELRALLGDWRGQTIRVDGPGRAFVYVVLSDWCACGDRAGGPTLIDLSRQAFAELADPSAGIVAVSVEWPQTALPATDAVRSPADLRMFREVVDEVYR